MRYGNVFRLANLYVDRNPDDIYVAVVLGELQYLARLSIDEARQLGYRLLETTGADMPENALLLAMAKTIARDVVTFGSLELESAIATYERAIAARAGK